MHLRRIGRSETRCIDVKTLKQNERVSHQSEDGLMALWIEAAEDLIELRTSRAIMRQTLRLSASSIAPTFCLPRMSVGDKEPRIIKITKATAHDLVEVDPATVTSEPIGGYDVFRLPGVKRLQPGRLTIEFETGEESAAGVPAAIRQAALLLASTWYRSREAINTDMRMRTAEAPLPFGAEALIQVYRVPNLNVEFDDPAWGAL